MWHVFSSRCCVDPPEKKNPEKIREKRLVAKAFKKKLRRDLKKGRLSFSYGNDKDDPLGKAVFFYISHKRPKFCRIFWCIRVKVHTYCPDEVFFPHYFVDSVRNKVFRLKMPFHKKKYERFIYSAEYLTVTFAKKTFIFK